MSEARNTFGKTAITKKSKKLKPRVDLTAMVSVSFLLIVFFMLSSFLSRSNAMELGMPEHSRGGCYFGGGCGDNRSITLLLGKNNKIITYTGNLSLPLEGPKELTYDKKSLEKELFKKTTEGLNDYYNPKKGLIVIIKPSKNSNYGDLVNVLDEMAIVKVPTYAVVDITPEEENLLISK